VQQVFRRLLVSPARSAVVRRELSLVAVFVVIGACLAPAASATTTFAVADTADAALTSSTGTSCASTDGGKCTLRAAIQAADNLGGDVTITLPAGTFPITIAPSASADDPSTGDFDIDKLNSATIVPTVTITGQGPDSTIINANSLDRAFTLEFGSGLSLSGVSIEKGEAPITGPTGYDGGAIFAYGALTVSDSEFYDDAGGGEGGAIYAAAAASVTDSTFTADVATTAGGAFATPGGGVVALVDDTFDTNVSGNSTIGDGGAIAYVSNNPLPAGSEIVNSTIARNSATSGSGGIYYAQYAGKIENTIVADNTAAGVASNCGSSSNAVPDETGLVAGVDDGGNLDSDGSCFSPSVSGDEIDANPMISKLAGNGGPTETDALVAGSPAIGEAIASACPTTDQRGVSRISTSCDSGAYQGQEATLSVAASSPSSVQTGQDVTASFLVTNTGPYPAAGITFSDALPGDVSLPSASASQGACSTGQTISCSLGTLAAGATATVTVTVAYTRAGQNSTSASVSFAGINLSPHSSVTSSIAVATPGEPVNTARPTIGGDATIGQSLTVDPGTWSGDPTFAYQWYRCDGSGKDCSAIPGAVYATYQPAPRSVGGTFEVKVTATNSVGSATATSSASAPIAAAPADVKTTNTTTSGASAVTTLGCQEKQLLGCDVYVTLEVLAALGGLRSRHEHPTMSTSAAHRSKIVLGSLRVKIRAGHKVKVRIKLNRAGKRLLAKKHRLKVVMTITQTGHKPIMRTIVFRTKQKNHPG
jgi:uncharacterized repeat protein (TIGR01451 family)